jgi:hypothetical protein
MSLWYFIYSMPFNVNLRFICITWCFFFSIKYYHHIFLNMTHGLPIINFVIDLSWLSSFQRRYLMTLSPDLFYLRPNESRTFPGCDLFVFQPRMSWWKGNYFYDTKLLLWYKVKYNKDRASIKFQNLEVRDCKISDIGSHII